METEFYILDKDYSNLIVFKKDKKEPYVINRSTSVVAYKRWFFDCLSQLGKIIPVKAKLGERKLRALLARESAIFVSVNYILEEDFLFKIPHRLLRLTLGLLFLPQYVYTMKYLPSAQVNLVSTQFQLDRLRSTFGNLAPEMAVFNCKVDTDYYTIPNHNQRLQARKQQRIGEKQLHIIYAGRLIMTKGICQLIRALDIWPVSDNIVITIAGNIEDGAGLAFSLAKHTTFSQFLNEEVLRNKKRHWLRFQAAKDKQELRELFWSADLFVNLSIQPDENFGITPHEAMSCGLPIVTTNFGGLRSLAESMLWKGVDTYPTVFGARFSLKQFRVLLQRVIIERNSLSSQEYRNFVLEEFNPQISKNNLKKAIEYLIKRPPEMSGNSKRFKRDIKKQLFNFVDDRILKWLIDTRRLLPRGAYVYGDEPCHFAFPIVQGIYSAMSMPPKVDKNSKWRGFFKISLWDKERALVEFGFPGPRIHRYSNKQWNTLVRCIHYSKLDDEYVAIPRNKEEILIIQELVNLGYLVSDDF